MFLKFIKNSFLVLILLSYGSMAISMEQPNQNNVPIEAINDSNNNDGSLKKIFKNYCMPALTFGAFHFGTALAHEYGHKITNQLLLGNSGTVHLTLNGAHTTFSKPLSVENWQTIAVALAGPAVGIASSLCLLKISNIIDEYCGGKSILTAIKEGLKKPFFLHLGNNRAPMLIARMCAFVQIGFNLYNLVPYQSSRTKSGVSDGYIALATLKTLLNKTPKKIEPNPSWWQRIKNWSMKSK